MEEVDIRAMELILIVFKEEEGYIAYCPALELCGCGKTKAKAQQSFKIVLEEYIKYTTENQTLIEDLIEHGWKIKEKNKRLIPPKISELLQKSNDLEDIFTKHDFNKYNIPVKMQLM